MDTATFISSLPPDIREEVLVTTEDDVL